VINKIQQEIAALAAQLIVEDGLEYGPAKRRAAKMLGLRAHVTLPGNHDIEDAVRDYIAVFCADTQPAELRVLRMLALSWMERLAMFRPHLGGAVWHGTATRRSDIYLQLFCDDCKSAEMALIDRKIRYEVSRVAGFRGEAVDALSIRSPCPQLQEEIGVHLMIYDFDDVRGALKPDAYGRVPRGDKQAVLCLLAEAPS